jgi:hypothetical protein
MLNSWYIGLSSVKKQETDLRKMCCTACSEDSYKMYGNLHVEQYYVIFCETSMSVNNVLFVKRGKVCDISTADVYI